MISENWIIVGALIVVFVALYPQDATNIAALIAMIPRLARLWLSQRLMMLRLGPRLMVDTFLLRRRASAAAKRYNKLKETNQSTNNE